MLGRVDGFLNRITMYRLLLYYLIALLTAAVAWLFNTVVARVWKLPMNSESSLLTALILSLIITPGRTYESFLLLLSAALLAMASKYILAISGKHLFNPAALGAVVGALFFEQGATWWAGGNLPMLPLVLVGGMLVVRKLRRADLVLAFLGVAMISTLWPIVVSGGALLGLFFSPSIRVFSIYFTPELALIVGNVFSCLISPKFKAVLKLKEKREIAADTYEFVFSGQSPEFLPGQYAEWTLASEKSDSRGNRRYFT